MEEKSAAVISVIYPEAICFLDSYLKSLETQTFTNFDLLLGNDNVEDLGSFIDKYNVNTHTFRLNGSPVKNRIDLINIALSSGYESIIFSDCDDIFSQNRIEQSLDLLNYNDVVVNDLDIISFDGSIIQFGYFSNRIEDGSIIKSSDLLHLNMMGLTNVAVNRNVLLKCAPILNNKVVALDWLLWTYVLLSGHDAKFTSSTSTLYRVHSNNIAGLPQEINKSLVLSGLKVKMLHYSALKGSSKRAIISPISYHQNLTLLYNNFSLAQKMSLDSVWLDEYILALKAKESKYPLWWENIKTPEQVRML